MSVNKVILIGNVGNDVEVRSFDNGGKLAKFSLATTKRAVKKDDKEIPERTDWHNVLVPGKLAEIAEKYVKKGMRLYVEGEIRYREYEKDGQKRYITEICCHSFELLSKKQEEDDDEAPF